MRQAAYFDVHRGEDRIFRSEWVPVFAKRKIGESWFVANTSGGWAFLSDDELRQTESVSLDDSLFRKLEDRHLILTAGNTASYMDSHRRWTEPHYRHPVHHILVSTLRCNLSCTYCHVAVQPANAGSENDLSIEMARKIVDFAAISPSEIQSFEFQGGESLLNFEMLEAIIPYIREVYDGLGIDVYLSLQTNNLLLSRDKFNFLQKHRVSIGTSYDGTDSATDRQRVNNGGRPVGRQIRKQIEKYGLSFLPTITANNLDEWRAVINAQLAAGNDVVTFQPAYPINNAKANWPKIGFERTEFNVVYNEVADFLRGLWDSGYYPMERRQLLALKKLIKGRDVDFADFGNPCGMVHGQLLYDRNGDIYTCDEGRDFPDFKIGNVATSRYDEVVFGDKTLQLKSLSLPNDDECQTCAYRAFCSACPVYERAVTGQLHSRHAGTDNCIQSKLIFDKVLGWYVDRPETVMEAASNHGLC